MSHSLAALVASLASPLSWFSKLEELSFQDQYTPDLPSFSSATTCRPASRCVCPSVSPLHPDTAVCLLATAAPL